MNKYFLLFAILILTFGLCSCQSGTNTTETGGGTDEGSTPSAESSALPETAPPEEPADFVNIKDFDRGDGWNKALERAFAVSDTVYFPQGKYRLDTVYLNDNQTIFGDGDETVIEQISDKLFWIDGKVTASSDLAADMKDFSNELETLAKLNVKRGDLIYLLSQRNTNILEDCGYEWCQGRSYYNGHTSFFSEFLTVKEAEGNKIITEQSTIFPFYYKDDTRESDPKKPTSSVPDWPYRRRATTVYLIDPAENVTVRDISIENAHGRVFVTHWSDNLLVSGVRVSTKKGAEPAKKIKFVDIFYSRGACIKNCDFIFSTLPSDIDSYTTFNEYGYYTPLYIYAGYECGFDSCSINFSTRGFNIGKCDKKGISYGCYVKNCTSENARWAGITVNSGAYDTVISGNKITGCAHGIMQGGRKCLISDNEIIGGIDRTTSYYYVRPNEGGSCGIMLFEGYAVDAVVKNNRISEVCTGVLIRDGYEDTNIFEQGPIEISDNVITEVSTGVMTHRNSHNTKTTKFELTVSGNKIVGGKRGSKYMGATAYYFSGSVSDVLVENNSTEGFLKLSNLRTDAEKRITVEQ